MIVARMIARLRARRRPEPCVAGAVHRVDRGHAYVAAIPASSPHYYAGLGVFDMIECPECGPSTVCSS